MGRFQNPKTQSPNPSPLINNNQQWPIEKQKERKEKTKSANLI
jgi:hypothetical protein